MNKLQVNIVADSINDSGSRLITLHARYPRIIHGEVMTHRVFSRNARSSRAVPVKTMLEEIRNDPFVPWHWGANISGMQAKEECNNPILQYTTWDDDSEDITEHFYSREEAWLDACEDALHAAQKFMNAGYHKQIANRLLEPFSYIDTLISSTSWANFYHLRDHEDAEPHFHDLASLIRKKVDESTPNLLKHGEWHFPYIIPEELELYDLETLKKLSVARCARISYKPFDGDASIEKELQRYELLVGSEPLHASPTEHQATPDVAKYTANFGAFSYYENKGALSGNFDSSWIQNRKTLKNEFIFD
jgi:hypothetical protein